MRWLQAVDGPVEEFNQTVVVQAPAGVTEADVVVVLQALLDRHAMLRLRVDDGAGGWSLQVPEPGSVDAGGCLQSVDVLSDEALVAARSRLNPAAGVMLSALWVAPTGQLVVVIHHLAVDGVSWRILLEDLNIAWAQHRNGQPVALPAAGHVVCPVGVSCWLSTRALRKSWTRRASGSRWRRSRRRCRRCNLRWTRSPAAGTLVGVAGCGDHPAAAWRGAGGVSCRHPGHLVDRVRLGGGGIFGCGRRPDRHRRGGPRPRRGAGRRCGPVAHGGLVHHQIPGVPGRRWAGLGAGDRR